MGFEVFFIAKRTFAVLNIGFEDPVKFPKHILAYFVKFFLGNLCAASGWPRGNIEGNLGG